MQLDLRRSLLRLNVKKNSSAFDTLIVVKFGKMRRLTWTVWLNFMELAMFLIIFSLIFTATECEESNEYLHPTITVAILVRNKAHILPWFLGQFENLNYPKDRISLWIRSDHNVDDTNRMLGEWLASVEDKYHSIDVKIDSNVGGFPDESGPCDWSRQRFDHVIQLRQEALDAARKNWADYLFMLDADVILENVETLSLLIQEDKTIVGPMLNASIGQTYSNFWGGMTNEGYYKRVPEYFQIVDRKILGCFPVPMVHTALLIDLHRSVSPSFRYVPLDDYKGPVDDIIVFADSVRDAGVSMHIVNTEYFGKIMIPMDTENSLQDATDQFIYVKLEAQVDRPGLLKSPYIDIEYPEKDTMGFDQVYMINLLRRPKRRKRMLDAFRELGIQSKIFDAVDGKQLNDSYLDQLGVKMLPGFLDPYGQRPLTMGEIGCFLSHYFIWKDIEAHGYQNVIIFEDDIRFEPYFRTKVIRMMQEVEIAVPDWDLIYVGRKRLFRESEPEVKGTSSLVYPHYSYWTLSYIISGRGTRKLLDQKPLSKMVPVDEFLPIMFDKHPTKEWKEQFSPRNLIAMSADPLLVYPTHYTGEPNYFSDTEDSVVIPVEQTTDNKLSEEEPSPTTAQPSDTQSKDEL